mmetsp:Transcript_5535/g.14139  ORF Transcript_5535/g.14139 Transcript_5535/m.14139 type:complete len:216 (-) Transcript_5535:405-1052(-)
MPTLALTIVAAAAMSLHRAAPVRMPISSVHSRVPRIAVQPVRTCLRSRVLLAEDPPAAEVTAGPAGDEAAGVLAETTTRSLVKALSWRLTAAVVTLCTSLFFSGSMIAAMGVVGADFLTKSVTMFIGERLWNKSNVGRSAKGDSVGRSLLKAFVWRVFAAVNTLISAGIITGGLEAAYKIAGSDAIIKTALFFGFERIWAVIPWGRYVEEAPARA